MTSPSSSRMIRWPTSSWVRSMSARKLSSKKCPNGPWPTSWRSPATRRSSSTSGAEGASGNTALSDGQSCWAKRPATCIAPRAWGKRLCSAVGKTQRADWSCGMRRRRCTQGVSIRSCSVASPGGDAVGPGVEEVPVDGVDDEPLAPVRLGARHARLHEPDLAAVTQHEVVRARLRGRPVDLDVPAEQARLDPRPDVGQGRALEDDRVLDLAAADRGHRPRWR